MIFYIIRSIQKDMDRMKVDIFIKFCIHQVIDNVINEATEKYALKSLSKSSFRQMIRKNKHHLIFDSNFMTRNSYDYVYPSYFHHG